MKTLRQLLGLCDHNWKQLEKCEVTRFVIGDRERTEHTVAYDYILRCEKCGDLKRRRL